MCHQHAFQGVMVQRAYWRALSPRNFYAFHPHAQGATNNTSSRMKMVCLVRFHAERFLWSQWPGHESQMGHKPSLMLEECKFGTCLCGDFDRCRRPHRPVFTTTWTQNPSGYPALHPCIRASPGVLLQPRPAKTSQKAWPPGNLCSNVPVQSLLAYTPT